MAAIVFDLDDTLYPRVRHVHSGFSAVARAIARRFDLPADVVYRRLKAAHDRGHRGTELQDVCASFRLNEVLVPDLVQIMRSHEPQIWLSYDAGDVLLALRARGWRTAVLTNGIPSVQAAKVRALGLHELVDHVLYADEHAPGGKPAADVFLAALNRLEVAPQNAVMVGDDRVNDIEGARAVGMRTILLARGERPQHDGGADMVVQELTDLPRVALNLVQDRTLMLRDIGGRSIGLSSPVFVIAEIGLNHGGSLTRAIELVDAAAEAGASAVKLQTLDGADAASVTVTSFKNLPGGEYEVSVTLVGEEGDQFMDRRLITVTALTQ